MKISEDFVEICLKTLILTSWQSTVRMGTRRRRSSTTRRQPWQHSRSLQRSFRRWWSLHLQELLGRWPNDAKLRGLED
jgi:hypothetical protein